MDLTACTPERALVVLMAWITRLAELTRSSLYDYRPAADRQELDQQSDGAAAFPAVFISAGAAHWTEDMQLMFELHAAANVT